jgi:glutathione S-transferase
MRVRTGRFVGLKRRPDRAQLGWMDEPLATGRRFMLGNEPALPDALAYYLVWFVRGRWQDGPGLLPEFPALEARDGGIDYWSKEDG